MWSDDDVKTILTTYGVVVIERSTAASSDVIFSNDLLHSARAHIVSVNQHIVNDISSTKVRLCIKRGLSIKYLTPDSVIEYIRENKLYEQ